MVKEVKQVIIKVLEREFGDEVAINLGAKRFAAFAARHSSVGDVVIEEYDDELVVWIGAITFGYFGSYEPGLSLEEHALVISKSVVSFLVDLFADKYYLRKSKWSHGWVRSDKVKESDMQSPKVQWFRWSGPIDRLGVPK